MCRISCGILGEIIDTKIAASVYNTLFVLQQTSDILLLAIIFPARLIFTQQSRKIRRDLNTSHPTQLHTGHDLKLSESAI